MTTTVQPDDTNTKPARPVAKPAINWHDEPLIVRVENALRTAMAKPSKGGIGALLTVTEADRPGTPIELPGCDHDPGLTLVNCQGCTNRGIVIRPEPVPGCTVRVIVPTPGDAQVLRAKLGAPFDIDIEEAVGPSTATALYFWVPGLHGRVGTYTNHRCREVLCQSAWRQKNQEMKEERHRRLLEDPTIVEHGLPSTRINYLCTCDLCKAAHAGDAHGRKQRARLRDVLNLVEGMGGQVTVDDGPDGKMTVYLVLPTVDAATEIAAKVQRAWPQSQLQGFQVVVPVEPDLAAQVGLAPVAPGELVATG